jgi:hypothetical protein
MADSTANLTVIIMFRQALSFVNIITAIKDPSRHYDTFVNGVDGHAWTITRAGSP